jgi:Xaa-Pro aminopeptidase
MLEKLRETMSDERIPVALVTRPVSIRYLTGFAAEPHERLLALVVRPDSSVLVVPALEEENALRHAAGAEVLAWRDGEDALGVLRSALGGPARLGVEKDHLTVARAEGLAAGELVDLGAALYGLRAVKSPAELELLREAARRTDAVTAELAAELRRGMTELEVAARIDSLIRAAGCEASFPPLVQSGPNSALPHLRPGERAISRGDLVLLDFGCRHQGYCADTTRMAVAGEPDARQREVHAAVLEAHDRAIAAIRPGAACGQVDAAAREVLVAAGLGEAFIHRTGHGLGLEGHEEPNLTPGSAETLRPGHCVTVEPGAYLPGWGGVRIEDDVAVGEAGAEVLTSAAREFMVIDS